jgi:hypothetical protein
VLHFAIIELPFLTHATLAGKCHLESISPIYQAVRRKHSKMPDPVTSLHAKCSYLSVFARGFL